MTSFNSLSSIRLTCFCRGDPCIHVLYDECEQLLNKLMGRLVPLSSISRLTLYAKLINIIGLLTKQKLTRLESEGDCTPTQKGKFYVGVRSFYEAAIKYILEKFPFNVKHAKFLNFDTRSNCHHFASRYRSVPSIEASDML